MGIHLSIIMYIYIYNYNVFIPIHKTSISGIAIQKPLFHWIGLRENLQDTPIFYRV